MVTLVRCGTLFTGEGESLAHDSTIVVDGDEIKAVLPSESAYPPSLGDELHDFSDSFVMPGLVDVHTHLAYGNAKSEEDIDLYAPLEFRALRGMFFAKQVTAAGYTSIGSPGDSGMVSLAIRNAIDAGLFEGPRVTAAGPYITSRQGLTDWYPSWIGAPSTSIGRLVRSLDEAIEEVRRQVKDGVDTVKFALDGILRRPNGEFVAAFTQNETTAMVDEVHRLGRIAIAHARGREATLYAARAGVDLIFHASQMDDEGLDWVLRNNCMISPSLTLLRNTIDFMQPSDAVHRKSKRHLLEREFESATIALDKARRAGVPMPTGTDSGFAVTPYGEWHAREIEIYVNYLGFTSEAALQAATSVSAKVLRPHERVGTIAPGFKADLIALVENPLTDVSILLDRTKLKAVMVGGKLMSTNRTTYDAQMVSDFSMTWWNDLYTQERVRELRRISESIKL